MYNVYTSLDNIIWVGTVTNNDESVHTCVDRLIITQYGSTVYIGMAMGGSAL